MTQWHGLARHSWSGLALVGWLLLAGCWQAGCWQVEVPELESSSQAQLFNCKERLLLLSAAGGGPLSLNVFIRLIEQCEACGR